MSRRAEAPAGTHVARLRELPRCARTAWVAERAVSDVDAVNPGPGALRAAIAAYIAAVGVVGGQVLVHDEHPVQIRRAGDHHRRDHDRLRIFS